MKSMINLMQATEHSLILRPLSAHVGHRWWEIKNQLFVQLVELLHAQQPVMTTTFKAEESVCSLGISLKMKIPGRYKGLETFTG